MFVEISVDHFVNFLKVGYFNSEADLIWLRVEYIEVSQVHELDLDVFQLKNAFVKQSIPQYQGVS